MMLVDSKKVSLTINIISIVIGILLACLGIFCYEEFIEFICVTIGIGMVIVNGFLVFLYTTAIGSDKRYIFDLCIAIINLSLGILFIFNHGLAVSIVFGAFLIVLPLVRILISEDKKTQFIKEIPFFIIGILLFFNVADVIFRVAIIVFGVALVLLGIINIVLSNRVVKTKKNDNDYIDVDIKNL